MARIRANMATGGGGGGNSQYTVMSPQLLTNDANSEITIQTGLTEVKHFLLEGHQIGSFTYRTYLEFHDDGFMEDNTVKIMRYSLSSQSVVQGFATSSSDTIAAQSYGAGLISRNGGEITIRFGTAGTWYKQNYVWYAG